MFCPTSLFCQMHVNVGLTRPVITKPVMFNANVQCVFVNACEGGPHRASGHKASDEYIGL